MFDNKQSTNKIPICKFISNMKLFSLSAFVFVICSFGQIEPEQGFSLGVTVTNIKKSEGEILVALFRLQDQEAFPEDIDNLYTYKIIDAQSPSVRVVFENLAKGAYAYSIVQDFNGNKYTDKNFVGYPVEPYGFSTNFKPLFSAPDFRDCRFELSADTEHYIKLIH